MPPIDRPTGELPAREADLFDLALLVHAVYFAVRAPLRHPWLAVAAFLLVASASAAGVAFFPKRYEVTTTILAGSPLSGALVGDRPGEHDSPTRAAREILLRRENLRALAEKTNFAQRYLAERPIAIRMVHTLVDFVKGEERDPESVEKSLVDTLEERLWVNVSQGETVTITFRWWDKQIAFDMVQAAAQSFLEMRRSAEIDTLAESIRILTEHQGDVEKRIESRIAALEKQESDSREKGIQAPRRLLPGKSVSTRAPKLKARLAAVRGKAAELESARQRRIVELRTKLLQEQTVYAPDHPTIIATQRMLDALEAPSAELARFQEEEERLSAEIARRTHQASGQVEGGPLSPVPLFLDQDPREAYARGQIRALRSQLAGLREDIASDRLRLEKAKAAFDQRYSVVAPPELPKGPIKPYNLMFILSGLVGGIMLAVLASVAFDLRSGKVLETWQIEHQIGIRVLGRSK